MALQQKWRDLTTLDPMSASKERIYRVFMVVFVSILIVSNVLALKTFTIGFVSLPCSILVYPVVYIVNDVVSDIFGFRNMRFIILCAFLANAVATLFFSIAVIMPVSDSANDPFALIFAPSWRILLASYASYLAGSILNSYVMSGMKKRFENNLFFRCVASTMAGEAVDATVFLGFAFFGTMDNQALLIMIVSQWALKVTYEIVAYPLTRKVIVDTRKRVAA